MNADLHAASMRKGCPCEKRTIGRREVIVAPDPDCPRHGIREGVASIPHLRRHAYSGEDDRSAEARLYAEALRVVYRYHWANNPRRAELKGRECVVEARGRLGTVLLRFLDTGERVTTSARAVRRLTGGTRRRVRAVADPTHPRRTT